MLCTLYTQTSLTSSCVLWQEIAALIDCCDQEAAEGKDKPVHCAFNQRYRRLLAEAGQGQQGTGGQDAQQGTGSVHCCLAVKSATSSAVMQLQRRNVRHTFASAG